MQRHNILGIQRATDNTYVETTVAAAPNVGDNIIIVSDTSEIKAGMLVSHPGFPNSPGTGPAAKVINVGTYHVEFDTNITNPIANGSTIGFLKVGDPDSTTWENYKSSDSSENTINDYQDYQNDIYWPNEGRRFGLDPQRAQVNGYFYICGSGKIHFSSNLVGKTIVLDYISDRLGTDGEMAVHKFAEEAIYKWISYGILSSRINTPEYIINRFKKEKFAETRKAKLRLSNLKLEELTQILRGKSKQIKH